MLEGNETIASGFAETREDDSQTDENVFLVNVKVGKSRIIQSKRSSLIAISGFFESMLALKPSDDETIDLTSFCDNEIALMTLALHADYGREMFMQWGDPTTANIIFLVDPLQLSNTLQKFLTDSLREAMRVQTRTTGLIATLGGIIARRPPSELQIDAILTMLFKFEAKLSKDEQNVLDNEKYAEGYQPGSPYAYYSEKKQFFDGALAKYQPLKLAALMICALWLMEMHKQEIFVPLVAMKKKYDMRVGLTPPDFLLECDRIVPGLLYWIKVIYVW